MRVSIFVRMSATLLCAATLSGCPFGESPQAEPTQHDVRAAAQGLHLLVSGTGLTPQGGSQYAYILGNAGNPSNALSLKALLKAVDVTAQAKVTSSNPAVIAVKQPGLLNALAAGDTEINVTHAGQTATVTIKVVHLASAAEIKQPESLQYRVTKSALWDSRGPTNAMQTDHFKCGNGGAAHAPVIWATIVNDDGAVVSGHDCTKFIGRVTPDMVPSGWPNDSRGMEGLVRFYDTNGSDGFEDAESPGGCGFNFPSMGFPIIGSGIKQFKLHVLGTCQVIDTLDGCGAPGYPPCDLMLIPKVCGAPLPGGSINFGVEMQSVNDERWC